MDLSSPPPTSPRFTRPPDEAYTPSDPAYAQHQLVNQVISEGLINRLTGRGDGQDILYGAQPSNQYFAGALVSQYEYRQAQSEDETFQNFAQDISPFTIGIRFRLPASVADDAEIDVTPSAVGYQRRFPTLDEQQQETNENEEADVLHERSEPDADALSPEDENEDGVDDGGMARDGFEELVRVYERVPFDWGVETWTGAELKELAEQNESNKVRLPLETAFEQVEEIPNTFRERTSGVSEGEANEVPTTALETEKTFQDYLEEVYSGDTLHPLWSAELEINARYESPTDTDEEYLNVNVRLVNTHGRDFEEATDPEYEDWRDTLFDVGVDIEFSDTELRTFDSKEIENEYQYDGTIHAVGENCAIEPVFPDDSDNQVDAVGVRTETVPTYEQAKYLSRNPSDIEARMDVLAGSDGREAVFETLERIASAMEAAAEDYRAIKNEMTTGKTSDARDDFDDAVAAFEYERERLETGIQCLRDDERAYEAFTLCNQAFANLGEFNRWRTFQIVFIVMSVVDVLKQASGVEDDVAIDFDFPDTADELDAADIIYFPTGGGKTEAYLGAVTFTAFHDRLRGKGYGMTAFTKFPLRFLSLQQLQRAADVLAQAELLRRDRGLGGEEFSVGYLVGKQNTPNALFEDGRNKLQEVEQNEEYREDLLYVDVCPFCGEESVEITSDRIRGRIIHQCTDEGCDEGELPIYISDREVYRYAPTFVVSTIDKISIIGMQRRMRTIFGQAKIRCSKHGYSGESECVVDEHALLSDGSCSAEDWEKIDPVEPPSLLIQDELHLLREEFGAFDSHYETFLQAYNNRVTDGNWNMKVIAATATIEGARRQVRALYQKPSNIFPAKGPRLRQSFYAYADPIRTQRRMIGAIPRSISRTYAIEKVHEEYARIIQEYRHNLNQLYQDIQTIDNAYSITDAAFPDDEDDRRNALNEVLDDYEVQVSYHYSKDNTDMMTRVLRQMINQHLNDDGDIYHQLVGELLTGETDLGDVREVLRRLLNYDIEDIEPVDMIIATSMISHGVDIDRLNFIGFFGLPRQTAEYIQSYSRVGRKWPGTVFMLHTPMRVRDRSYYTRFQQYQAYQDLLVEATPLERWAEFAIQCTMPGIFCAALLQYYDFQLEDDNEQSNRVYFFDGFEEAARRGVIQYDELFEFVEDAYGLGDVATDTVGRSDEPRSGVELYREQIEEEFERLWDACLNKENRIPDSRANDRNTDENNFVPLGVLGRDDSVRTPMRNLRDIDEQITIALDSPTSRIVKNYRR